MSAENKDGKMGKEVVEKYMGGRFPLTWLLDCSKI